MVQSLEWKPGDASKLIAFHKRAEAAQDSSTIVETDDQRYEALASAWLTGHGATPLAFEEGQAVTLLPGEKAFYNVSDLIADLKAGTLGSSVPQNSAEQNGRLPLGMIVRFSNGIEAVITGHSTASRSRYRASWFDRRSWETHHHWVEKEAFEVIGMANKTASA